MSISINFFLLKIIININEHLFIKNLLIRAKISLLPNFLTLMYLSIMFYKSVSQEMIARIIHNLESLFHILVAIISKKKKKQKSRESWIGE